MKKITNKNKNRLSKKEKKFWRDIIKGKEHILEKELSKCLISRKYFKEDKQI